MELWARLATVAFKTVQEFNPLLASEINGQFREEIEWKPVIPTFFLCLVGDFISKWPTITLAFFSPQKITKCSGSKFSGYLCSDYSP